MGTYIVSIPRQGHVTRGSAIRAARECATKDRVRVAGTPKIRARNSPIPLIGPRRAYVVTFPSATRHAS
jgi:hypothetical protein